ncbi:hypothetical protein BDF19DRAFT_437388 [Syncephalis fuscata]|nr:hypothetical protein BDF19DRAFT_437388 [Syncephalis fuscata]
MTSKNLALLLLPWPLKMHILLTVIAGHYTFNGGYLTLKKASLKVRKYYRTKSPFHIGQTVQFRPRRTQKECA